MPLFTSKVDKLAVPILTQYFQLIVPSPKDKIYDFETTKQLLEANIIQKSEGEIELLPDGLSIHYDLEYGVDLGGDEKGAGQSELARWVWSLEGNTYGQMFSRSHPNDFIVPCAQPAELERLARLHPVMLRLMNCAIDDLLPNQEDVKYFNKWREKTHQVKPPELIWKNTGGSTIVFDYPPDLGDIVRLIEIPIAEQFTEALYYHHHRSRPPRGARYPGFGRCQECQSTFVRTRPGQIYCSSRCGHRQGERRRYALLFELPPKTNLTPKIQKSQSEKEGGRPL